MTLLGNIIWLIFGGLLSAVGYIIGGIGLCLTIIGIPFGIQQIKVGIATLTPFGREVIDLPDSNSTLTIIFNVIWLVLFGWWIAVTHLTAALFLAITIIGLPFAKQHIKLVALSLFPFGKEFRYIED